MEEKSFDKFSGTINGHKYVDLGLSVKWATCNIGASKPEDGGDYYAWGETDIKSEYTEENSVTYRKKIDDIAGNPTYDVARAKWGSPWRLPTREEIEELIANCTTKWICDEVNGMLFTSNINDNTIFIPAKSIRIVPSSPDIGSGAYWSSTPSEESAKYSFFLYFDGNNDISASGHRDYGRNVRPVSD